TVIQNRIDAGDLLKNREPEGNDPGPSQMRVENGFALHSDGSLDIGGFDMGLLRPGNLSEDSSGRSNTAFLHEPARAFGNKRDGQHETQRRHAGQAEHPSPTVRSEPGEIVIDNECHQDPDYDGKLVQRDKAAAYGGG